MAARAGTKVVVIRDSEHTYFSWLTPDRYGYVTFGNNTIICVNSAGDWV